MTAFAADALPWLLAGTLALAVAAGPWAVLLGFGAAALLLGPAALPGDLEAFSSLPILLPATGLLLLDLLVRTWGPARLPWEIVHVPVRLLLPSFVLLLMIGPDAGGAGAGPFLLASGLAAALLVHRWGWIVSAETRGTEPLPRRKGGIPLQLVASLLAVCVVAAPVPTSLLAAVLLVVGAVRTREALHCGPLALVFARDFLAGLAGRGSWRVDRQLPRWLRRELQRGSARGDPGGRSPSLRATPALLYGEVPRRPLRAGWVVRTGDAPRFIFRSLTRVWALPLEGAKSGTELPSAGSLVVRTRLVSGRERIVLGVPRGGPTGPELAGDQRGSAPAGRAGLDGAGL